MLEVFVRKIRAVNTTTAGAVSLDEIPALDHEILDHSVKRGAFEPDWHPVFPEFARAKLPEVLGRLRANVGEQLHLHAANVLSANVDVKEDDGVVWIRDRTGHGEGQQFYSNTNN